MSAPIAVIDTGICNLRSVTKALEAVGSSPVVVRTPGEVDASGAEGLVLPGVGALRDCVFSLRSSGLDATVRDWIRLDRPFLGVCLGMQALFDESEEGGVKGLGVFPGRVLRFSLPAPLKVPHMGWNTVRFTQARLPAPGGPRGRGRVILLRPQLSLCSAGPQPCPCGVRLRDPVCRRDRRRACVRHPVPPGEEPGEGARDLSQFRCVSFSSSNPLIRSRISSVPPDLFFASGPFLASLS